MKMTRLLHQQHSDTEFAQYVPPPTHTLCVVRSQFRVSGCLRVSPGARRSERRSPCPALGSLAVPHTVRQMSRIIIVIKIKAGEGAVHSHSHTFSSA